ncbi:hypothetical protein, partial [Vibrio anguillarum]
FMTRLRNSMLGVNMFYVGVSHYYATGEGVTIYVASGSEESIRKAIPEYFHQGLTLLTPSDWLKAADGDCVDEYYQSDAEVLKAYLPMLWKQIEERALERGCYLEFFMKHHFNYA